LRAPGGNLIPEVIMWVNPMPITIGNKLKATIRTRLPYSAICYRRIERFPTVKISVTNRARGGELTSAGLAMARQRRINLNALESNLRILAPRKT
jgi:hypothetical protein